MLKTFPAMLQDSKFCSSWWVRPLRPKEIAGAVAEWSRRNGRGVPMGGRIALAMALHSSDQVMPIYTPGRNNTSPQWIPKAIYKGDAGIDAFLRAGCPWAAWRDYMRPVDIYKDLYLTWCNGNPARYRSAQLFAHGLRAMVANVKPIAVERGYIKRGPLLDCHYLASDIDCGDEMLRGETLYPAKYRPAAHLLCEDVI